MLKPNAKSKRYSFIGKGTNVLACLKKAPLDKIDEQKEISARKTPSKRPANYFDVKTRSSMFSNIQCPECKRKFGPKAAENHIKHCIEKAKVS